MNVGDDCPDCGVPLRDPECCACGWQHWSEEMEAATKPIECCEEGCTDPTHGPRFHRCTKHLADFYHQQNS